jgi:hypothetical protein
VCAQLLTKLHVITFFSIQKKDKSQQEEYKTTFVLFACFLEMERGSHSESTAHQAHHPMEASSYWLTLVDEAQSEFMMSSFILINTSSKTIGHFK